MVRWICFGCIVVASALVGRGAIGDEPLIVAPAVGTATEPVVRRVNELLTARLKQLRAFWPERVAPERPIRVELWGTLDEYRSATARRGAPIDNPACYFAAEGAIVLGFDGRRFAAPLRLLDERTDRLRGELRTAERTLAEQLRDDEKRFERDGTPRDQRKRLTAERRRAFQVTAAGMQASIDRAEQENRQTLDDATARLSAAAAHELFHAYVDACVYPPAKGALPVWLNEGLAQIVERAPASAALGRATRPDPLRLAQRVDSVKREDLIGLRDLLSADAAKYLVHDDNPSADAGRYYLAAWTVAQALLTDGKLVPGEALDRFVTDHDVTPLVRFERLVGMSAAEWERTHKK